MGKNIILIPGMNPQSAKLLFEMIRDNLKNSSFEISELSRADEKELIDTTKNMQGHIIVGKSAGGSIALEYQIEFKGLAALVLLAPAVEANIKYESIDIPVLIVHGTKDTIIPIENSRDLEKYIENCRLVEIENADHSFRGKEKDAAEAVSDWIISLK
jgi:pimeloyl-ACP methyl ester carboxylesterase